MNTIQDIVSLVRTLDLDAEIEVFDDSVLLHKGRTKLVILPEGMKPEEYGTPAGRWEHVVTINSFTDIAFEWRMVCGFTCTTGYTEERETRNALREEYLEQVITELNLRNARVTPDGLEVNHNLFLKHPSCFSLNIGPDLEAGPLNSDDCPTRGWLPVGSLSRAFDKLVDRDMYGLAQFLETIDVVEHVAGIIHRCTFIPLWIKVRTKSNVLRTYSLTWSGGTICYGSRDQRRTAAGTHKLFISDIAGIASITVDISGKKEWAECVLMHEIGHAYHEHGADPEEKRTPAIVFRRELEAEAFVMDRIPTDFARRRAIDNLQNYRYFS